MSGPAGLWMLGTLAIALLVTGLPAWILLIAVASIFGLVGVTAGAFPAALLMAMPSRILGLLESDLLQALPLYVLLGALLNHLPIARVLFRTGAEALGATRAGPALAGLGLGVLLAPMNGSVGASAATLARTVLPRLRDAGLPPDQSTALICATSTLGVVVPPSLVLILLSDAMMRAHTEAVNITHASVRIINTQDVFVGALAPAAILLVLYSLIAWRGARAGKAVVQTPGPQARDRVTAGITAMLVLGLLAAVTLGYLYAVEAAATGGVALLAYGVVTRALNGRILRVVLRDTLAISGALFALLVGATMFTLVVRAYGTDLWIQAALGKIAGGTPVALGIVLGSLALCALVLDAFEIIFVVVPVLIPQLLMQIGDATWVAVLTLLILQASFLMPPFGYALLMVRNVTRESISQRALAQALAPYLFAQLAVLILTLAWPGMLMRHAAATDDPAMFIREREGQQQSLEQQLDQNAIDVPLPDAAEPQSTPK